MNKGLQIRNNKLKKLTKKRNVIKEEQKNICRFVEIKFEEIRRINGKYTHLGQKSEKGLQIRNRVYLINGHYKLVNNRGTKIIKKYEGIPEWANEDLIKKYNDFINIYY